MKDLKKKVLDIIQEKYPELRKEEYDYGDRFIINSDFFGAQEHILAEINGKGVLICLSDGSVWSGNKIKKPFTVKRITKDVGDCEWHCTTK